MAQLLDNVLDSLQQKLETQLDSAVGIDLKTDRETESDEDEPADVKALRARVRKAEADAKALLNEGADLSTKLGRSEQRNKTLRAELADRERVIARLESRGPPVDDGEERARLEGEAASLEARAASLELENGSLKRLAAASAETRDKLAKTERLLAAAVAERDASRADAAAARRDAADALVAARGGAEDPRVAALEAELEEVRAAVRRRDADAALNLRDGVALATGDAEARLAAALRERDAAQSLVATTRTELRNITSERDALRKREERRPSDGADAARLAADRDALEARLREAVAANAALRRDRRAPAAASSKVPDRALEDECARLRTRLEALSADARVHGVQLERARAATADALAQRDATKQQADAAVARAIATMKGAVEKARSDAAREIAEAKADADAAREDLKDVKASFHDTLQVVLAADGPSSSTAPATSRPSFALEEEEED
jgi:hypothetical protein